RPRSGGSVHPAGHLRLERSAARSHPHPGGRGAPHRHCALGTAEHVWRLDDVHSARRRAAGLPPHSGAVPGHPAHIHPRPVPGPVLVVHLQEVVMSENRPDGGASPAPATHPAPGAARSPARAAVTGAAAGIGAAVALLLAEQGAIVHAIDVNAEALEALAARSTGPGRIVAVPAD